MPHSEGFWLSIGSLVSADLPVAHYLVSVTLALSTWKSSFMSSGEGRTSVFHFTACVFYKTWLVLLLLMAEQLKSQEIEMLSKSALLIKENWVLSEH